MCGAGAGAGMAAGAGAIWGARVTEQGDGAVMQGWGTAVDFLCMRACASQRSIVPGMIGCCTLRVSMQSRSQNLSLPDIGVITLRRRDGTCGGARIGVDQALVWCCEWCELPIPDCRFCAVFACSAHQFSANTKQMRSLT